MLHSEYVNQEDLTKAARKVSDAKKHESKPTYQLYLPLADMYDSKVGVYRLDASFCVFYFINPLVAIIMHSRLSK